jgi:hypothetical protein
MWNFKRDIFRIENVEGTPVSCISIIGTVIAPVPQSGGNNTYGVKVEITPFPIDDNVTITGTIWNDSSPTESLPYSLTITAGNQSNETANNFLIIGPGDTASMSILTVTPTTVGYLGEAVNFCGFEPSI